MNAVLRRPGMYGRDETAEQLLLGAMAAVDGNSTRWAAEFAGLRERHAFTATGVQGAYRDVLPADGLREATASIYAGIAHRCGWLDLDRTLSAAEYQRLAADIGDWVTEDRTLSEAVDRFGAPSLWIGGTNPLSPKTLCYATASPNDELLCLHLWNTFANDGAEGRHPEPVVFAVRHRPGDFPGSFSFTPEGERRRPGTGRQSRLRPTVWIFHGEQARYASAVFETDEAGLAWAAEHGVTGILAEYPYGGAYDAAVTEGRFTPSKPHHGTTNHVAAFSPGLRHIHLVNGRRD
ncbi:hypothetical protein Q0Z83_027340 [Actinoplanes sichuanensis]|uniref:DUF7710 domain-containing protein n=1 Tax=Actinoplanes sichuanensis TaxID=512349 RepID=A0ABW4AVD7_9ACTN|nr:hypothetical protein [Actinoplanes sichuanensis]BEL04543.1 hypothetical protein Q0Z83_027340 [Actinoplanes sichuanensis]